MRNICLKLLPALALLVAAMLPSSAFATLLISINKTTQTMQVALNGRPLWQWPVSTGRAGYATPSGKFTPFRLEEDHYSKEWDDAPMPHAIFFTTKGHAIHGTFETRNLGRRASHGCVRLSTGNAARLFALVKQHGLANTRVVLFNDASSDPDAVASRRQHMPQGAPDSAPVALAPTGEAPAHGAFGSQTYGQTYGMQSYGAQNYGAPAPVQGAPVFGWQPGWR
jgi:hypothetical protein